VVACTVRHGSPPRLAVDPIASGAGRGLVVALRGRLPAGHRRGRNHAKAAARLASFLYLSDDRRGKRRGECHPTDQGWNE